jgi:hypothetical protein
MRNPIGHSDRLHDRESFPTTDDHWPDRINCAIFAPGGCRKIRLPPFRGIRNNCNMDLPVWR